MRKTIDPKKLYVFCKKCHLKYITINFITGKKKKIQSEHPVCMRCLMIDYNAQHAKKVKSN